MTNKLRSGAAALTAIALAAGLYSCSDDLPTGGCTPSAQQKLSFTVTTNDYQAITRAAAPQMIGRMVSDNGGEALSVTEVTDNSITGDASARATAATRGIPVENQEFATTTGYNGFKLMAATYDDSKTWLTAKSDVTATNFINKIDVLGSDDFETTYIWPGATAAKKVAFFAYAPYTNTTANSNVAGDLTVSNEEGTPQLTYTVPTDNVSKQFDLITATAVDVPGNHNNVQNLQFNHVLSCIKFAAGDLRDCEITDIKLTNIHYKGTYTFSDETGGMGTWENTTDTKTICIGKGETADSKSVQSRVTGQERNFVLNAGEKNLMMLPQTLEQGAQLQVSFIFHSVDETEKKTDSNGAQTATANGTVSRTYTIDLSGRKWESGKTYTYILSTNSVNSILLVERPKNFAYDGTTTDATFRISSYKYVDGGKTEPLAWTVKYYDVNESGAMGAEIDKPSWIEETTDEATNTTGGYQAYAMKLVAQQMTATGGAVSAITALQEADAIGTEAEPIDLSLRDVMGNELENGRSTANCYVVRQPGWYTFPLVYGNGIKNGELNGVALGSTTKLNAYGETINSQYIYADNGKTEETMYDAVIVWQDAPQLITPASVQLDEDHHFIKFQIEQRHITQGNAVLAVRDNNNKILWSWHIWVTAQDMSTIRMNTLNTNASNGITYADFMPVPLGYCDGVEKEYKKREFFVEVTQPASGMTATFKVTQNAKGDATYYGANAPYYNWGRKDVLLPSNGNGLYDKEIFDNQYDWKRTQNVVTLGVSIQNPFTYYYGKDGNSYDWCTTGVSNSPYYADLWTTANSGGAVATSSTPIYTKTMKTIYDPSPVGFCVPPMGAFSIFTNANAYSSMIDADATTGKPSGRYFTCDGSAYSSTTSPDNLIFLPVLLRRQWNSGNLYNDQTWFLAAQSGSSANYQTELILQTPALYYANSRNHAGNVISIKEE